MQAYVLCGLLALIACSRERERIRDGRLIPGDVIDLMLSQNDIAADKLSRDELIGARPRQADAGAIRALGLRYPVHGDFGQSPAGRARPSATSLFARLPVTFELGLIALIIAVTMAVPIGVYSGHPPGHGRRLSLPLDLVPDAGGARIWTGTMVMVLPSIRWGWSPEVKYVSFTENPLQTQADADPGLHLGTALSAITMRLTRTRRWRCSGRTTSAPPGPRDSMPVPRRCATRCATRWSRS